VISINGFRESVSGQPFVFLDGLSPVFVPVFISNPAPDDEVSWTIRDQFVSVEVRDVPSCYYEAVFLFSIDIPYPSPTKDQFSRAEKRIAQNIADIMPDAKNVDIEVLIADTDITKKRQDGAGGIHFVYVILTGEDPLSHATDFVIQVKYRSAINFGSTMEGVGALLTGTRGGIKQILYDETSELPPSASGAVRGGLATWEVALICVSSVAVLLVIALVVLLFVTSNRVHVYGRV
jgi:hypothetical protein